MIKYLRYVSILSFTLSFVFLINSFQGITGYSVLERVDIGQSSYFVFLFFIAGLILFYVSGNERESIRNKEGKIISIVKTHAFAKAAKKHDPKPIYAALEKIGTGLGNEEKLRSGGYSIKTSKGGRVVYNRKGEDYELIDFTPDHKY